MHATQDGEKASQNLASSESSKTVKNSVAVDFSEMPAKYRRRPLTQDEIDLVTVSDISFLSLLST